MKRRRQLGTIVILGLVAIVTGLVALRPREPVYQGKRLSEWLDAMSLSQFPDINGEAGNAIIKTGTNGLPFLVSALQAEDSPAKLKLMRFINKQSLLKLHFKPAADRHGSVLLAFHLLGQTGKLGPAAGPAIPALAELLTNSHRTSDGAFALLCVGRESVPALTAALGHSNQTVRAWAAVVLAKLKLERDQRGLALGSHPSPHSSRPVAFVGFSFSDVDVPAFVENLKSPDVSIRRASAEAIGEIRITAWNSRILPALLPLLKDNDIQVREAAAQTLKRIDPEAATKAGVK